MFTAFLGAWSMMELIFCIPLLLALGWATHLDRQGRDEAKWVVVSLAFVIYWIYFAIKSPPGEWFPPVFHKVFWTDSATYWSAGKYMGLGVLYVIFELVSSIIEEKGTIRARWNLELETYPDLTSYVTGAIGDEDAKYSSKVSRFCRGWNERTHVIELKTHPLERTPQPNVNFEFVTDNVFPWILLWPGYLVSTFFGRILDRIIDAINSAFRALGNAVVRILFRNTFNTN